MIQFGNKEAASITIGGKEVQKIEIGGKTAYEKPSAEPDYFYIENTYAGSNTLTLTTTLSGLVSPSDYSQTVQYSKDRTNWTTINFDIHTPYTISMDQGEKVYFRNDYGKFNYNDRNGNGYFTSFTATEAHVVGGDITTILDYTNPNVTLNDGCFFKLFSNDSTLTSASSLTLPSRVSEYCYGNAFAFCTNLTSLPSLPATTLQPYCYQGMFALCGIVDASTVTLPATVLADYCYSYMFQQCPHLITPPALPATTLSTQCYRDMFQGCSSMTTAPTLPATHLEEACYRRMFAGTSITTAPALPATTLAVQCYYVMFADCTRLLTPPTLPASTLVKECYKQIFHGCTLLNNITSYADNISASNCLTNWVKGVAATGTFHNLGSATYSRNASGIPTGWTEDTSNRFVFSNTVITNVGNNQARLTSDIQVNYTGTWDDGYFEVYNVFDRDRSIHFSPADISNGVLSASNLITESNVATLVSPATVTIYNSGTAVWTGSVSFTVVQ